MQDIHKVQSIGSGIDSLKVGLNLELQPERVGRINLVVEEVAGSLPEGLTPNAPVSYEVELIENRD